MIDIHSHIIPGIDDGSKNMEMTLEMLIAAEKSGTKKIVATPHYLMEYGEAKINEVKDHVEKINSIVNDEGINIEVYAGQEVYFTHNIINDYLEGNIGTINDSRYMLIEFSMRNQEQNLFDTLYELQVRNIVPIIAHPERYKYIINKPSIINDFINEGYLFQMNAGSLEGVFGDSVRKTAEILITNGIYNFIGSDAHNTTTRSVGISEGVDLANAKNKINGELIGESSRRLILNEDIEFCGQKIKEKKSIFSFFGR
ncbi:tyrosine-protein phosphatase [Clostridium saccharobutylicum]|uniref:protein-tyrosine-phosphatase n=1 Tax=Clostridium saccharobutylicum DSM 13864 TaxID=1345695 RepID=U5MX75_CLOSA|nr:CpsB/CapC family capsule biosynthesis tyrosine phosphatase [Clostridium saccharobutylicum]AGX45200.1 tyrosine-protein phosphatase YwqE [Clostridium saccharobutylicum DSM 13864]AQR92477.1 tyrosine-protein phosphatase YwqE [Clostridium saccharobutylicum]AQS02380.1 tyrosine-protein phosphatase YwqE [Clostridium saccharobutylicum]AQS16363.1 tyrosine-protein phosphatase YwqE [Clostridium saccharobutylicum]MBA2905043.1 protein-tyrosine phosphatase [Clostridium saccharobutylicum]